jgi:hypothetical protein
MPIARGVFPVERVKVDETEHTVAGHTVVVHTYANEYRRPFALIHSLLGNDMTYTERHMRAEAPEFYHSQESPDSVSYEEQKDALLDRVRESKQHKESLAAEVQ